MKRLSLEAIRGQELLAVIDRDPESQAVRDDFKALCAEANVQVHELRRYALENYFSLEAYREVFPEHIAALERDALDPDCKVQSQLGFNPRRKDNVRKLARLTSKEFLAMTDIAELMGAVRERAIARSLNRHALRHAHEEPR